MRIISSFILKMLNKIIVIFCAFIVLSCNNAYFPNPDRRMNMNTSPAIAVTLETELRNGDLIATLVFQNTSTHSVFLDKYTTCLSNEPINNFFNISNRDGALLNYSGIQVKRRFNKNDFVELKAGASIRASVVLNDWYQFQQGEHTYSISYNAFNHSYEEQKIFEMTSNEVVIKYDNNSVD